MLPYLVMFIEFLCCNLLVFGIGLSSYFESLWGEAYPGLFREEQTNLKAKPNADIHIKSMQTHYYTSNYHKTQNDTLFT